MTAQFRRFSTPELQHKLDQFLDKKDARIRRLEHKGAVYWAKKVETLSLRWRLQKGDPKLAFEAERAGFYALQKAGVPVPEIAAEGPNYMVTKDSGPILADLLAQQIGSHSDRNTAMAAAGRELALLRAKGLSHGRPAIKDMCWDGRTLRLLDFERYSDHRNTPKGHMQDLIIMVHSCYAFAQEEYPEITAATDAYRAHDSHGIWDMAATWCGKKRWLDWVTKPLQWGNREGAKEFKAIPMTLRAFGVNV